MGLDMYLNASRYSIGGKNEQEVLEMFPEVVEMTFSKLVVQAAYWRKANAIHRWFVNNVQRGKDDCGTYYVSREVLELLLALCKDVLSNKSKALEFLPPQEGFFFGSTTIDDNYFEDLQLTVDQLQKCLNLPIEWDFEYHSSW